MKPQTTERVAANVRAELAARRITGARFAEQMRWSRASTSRRLSGATSWSIDDVEKAAEYLGVTVLDLTAERVAV